MNSLVKRALSAGIGLALILGWWTLEDKVKGGSKAAASDKIPAKVWEGGGTTLLIDVESNDAAILRVYFEATSKTNGTPVRSLDTYEKVSAGNHSWTVDVPSAVGGDIELEASNPKPGSRLSWTVRAGERVLAQESESLHEPLRANEAFFLKTGADDFANVVPAE